MLASIIRCLKLQNSLSMDSVGNKMITCVKAWLCCSRKTGQFLQEQVTLRGSTKNWNKVGCGPGFNAKELSHAMLTHSKQLTCRDLTLTSRFFILFAIINYTKRVRVQITMNTRCECGQGLLLLGKSPGSFTSSSTRLIVYLTSLYSLFQAVCLSPWHCFRDRS